MQNLFVKISEDEWLKRFRSRLNHLDEDAAVDFGDGGTSFETCGEELEYGKSVDPAFVWTLYDHGNTISSGYHFVNRLSSFVCEIAVPLGEHFEFQFDDD